MRPSKARTAAVRAFNRFYTRRIGALGEGHLGSPFSLAGARVLYELAHRERPTASEIADALELDRGYLSRTLRAFKKRGFIATEAGEDRRRSHLRLTPAGKRAFAPLDRGARDAIITMFQPLGETAQRRTIAAMRAIREAFGDPTVVASNRRNLFTLRAHRPGDMGWVIHRHGVLYFQEWGYDETMEALIATIAAEFIQNFNPVRECCWIAERDGEIIGSIFVVEKSKTVAKLRLLLVEPTARGLGLGGRLVDEVIQFSKKAGYKKIVLWTQSELTAARAIYEKKGFNCIAEEKHHSFGKDLVAETWELCLT
ncbi:MAG: helix-turn-helix domain-containing GNAT family N-acetyltransferase [Gemmatimonadaceae bacterium]